MTYEPPGRGRTCSYYLLALRPLADCVEFTMLPIGELHDRDRLPFFGVPPLCFELVIVPAPQPP
jgi:hypothetical protein